MLVSVQRPPAPPVDDPAFPLAAALLGGGAGEVLGPILAEQGTRLQTLRPRQVLYVPGERITVTYAAQAEWSGGPSTTERVVVRAHGDGRPLEAWRFPDDPALPGLGAAVEPSRVRALLDAVGAPPGRPALTVRAYRPGNRAVVEVDLGAPGVVLRRDGSGAHAARRDRRLFLKILVPDRASEVLATHGRLAGRVPVAACRSPYHSSGVLVLDALPGQTLGRAAVRGGSALPTLGDLASILDAIPAEGTRPPRRRGPLGKVARHARLLRAVIPTAAGRIERLVDAIGEEGDAGPASVVHGDFHESQLLVAGGAVSGLLDVDGVGVGARVDDLATLIGRLWSLAHRDGSLDQRVADYAFALQQDAASVVDPLELHRRAAAVLLGRATGPFRHQRGDWWIESQRRIALAERWLGLGPADGT